MEAASAVQSDTSKNAAMAVQPTTASASPITAGLRGSTPATSSTAVSPMQILPPAIRLTTGSPTPSLLALPGLSGGAPLAPEVGGSLQRSLQVDLGGVRVFTNSGAQNTVGALSTRAVTLGNQILLGAGERPTDMRLMAHEAAHVVQQRGAPTLQRFSSGSGDAYEQEAEQASAAVLRGEQFTVREHTGHARLQGFLGIDLPNPLNWLADKANVIPGFRMFTIILGVNPINMSPVARSAANILRALIEFLPGGGLITQALDNSGVFEKAGAFVETQIASLGMAGSAIKASVTAFISSLSPSDILHLGDVWERAKRIFTEPIDRIISFGKGLVNGIIEIIKDAILKPIAKLAEGTDGYALLKAVMGKDPITGEPVPQTAEAIIAPFMKLIGQEEIWENMKKANAIARAFAWFKGALSELMGFVNQIPGLFVSAFKSLVIMDIVLVPRAFAKLVGVFGGFLGKFISWAGKTVWDLAEIIFEAVKPGALAYIKKTGAALKSILKDPLPFVGNLVKAAKLGFTNFADKFETHLKTGLIDWLTGSLPGVYIPQSFSLGEIVKFVFSVLGLSWANMRQKLVKATSETAVKAMETGFKIVMTLVTKGPAAAWEEIKDELSKLKDQVISGIISMVVEMIVVKAVPKLIAMFIPGAGFISAIFSIYDTIMTFVQKISKIIQVVTGFIDSIVKIAAGDIAAAATKVEGVLAGLLSLAISFLAGFAGLGKVADKVMGVINKIRAPIDKALDALVAWVVKMAKKLFAAVFGKKDEKGGDVKEAGDPKTLKGKAAKAFKAKLGTDQLDQMKVQSAMDSVFATFKPEGLKVMRLARVPGKAGVFNVFIGASAETKELDFEVDPVLRAEDLDLTQPKTVLFATVNEIVFGRIESEEHGLHAEEILLNRLKSNRSAWEKPMRGRNVLEINITRSPCNVPRHECGFKLHEFSKTYNTQLVLKIASLYKGTEGKHTGGSIAFLRTLRLGAKAKLEVWDVVAELEEKGKSLGIKKEDVPPETIAKLKDRIPELKKKIEDVERLKQKIG